MSRPSSRPTASTPVRPRSRKPQPRCPKRFVAWDNFVSDVVAAHAELQRHDEIKTYATALLGHSEGGLLALAAIPRITKNKPHALVLAATPGR